jgi:saccharopine dehydrogenase (NAD+, L-lysine-forming)
MEEFDPDTFMEELNKQGLPWKVMELDADATFEVKEA